MQVSPGLCSRRALALVSTVLSLYAAELALPHLQASFDGTPRRPSDSALHDSRTAFEVILDDRQHGLTTVPFAGEVSVLSDLEAVPGLEPPTWADAFALGGIANASTLLCRESQRWVRYMADQYGFRNPRDAWSGAAGNIVLLGDSFAHGHCVGDEDTIAGQLRRAGHAAVNLGVLGTGPLAHLGILREYGAAARPKHVVWLFYEGNDLQNLAVEGSHPFLSRYFDPRFSQGLVRRQDEIDRELQTRVARREEVRARFPKGYEPNAFAYTDARSFGPWREPMAPPPDRTWAEVLALSALRRALDDATPAPVPPLFGTVLDAVESEAARLGADLHFVLLPTVDRYAGPFIGGNPAIRQRDALIELVRRAQVHIVDGAAEFERRDNPLAYFAYDTLLQQYGHYTPSGYGVIAEAIARSVSADTLPARTSSSAALR